jgi:four helix bundle protein
MKENPKAEIRNPKEGEREIRRPKSEDRKKAEIRRPKADANYALSSNDAVWGDRSSNRPLILREDSVSAAPAPRDLAERTARFGETVIRFAKSIPRNPVNDRLTSQLVGAATSVGANYCEADDSVSGKEFKLKIGTCRKESKETMFFLRMVAEAEPDLANVARVLWREAKELNLIFGAIWRK